MFAAIIVVPEEALFSILKLYVCTEVICTNKDFTVYCDLNIVA